MPETKEALRFLAGLYKDKLLDQEFALNKTQVYSQKVVAGKTGMFTFQWHGTRTVIADNKKNDAKDDWVAAQFPTGQEGKAGSAATALANAYAIVPASSKHVDSVVKMLKSAKAGKI